MAADEPVAEAETENVLATEETTTGTETVTETAETSGTVAEGITWSLADGVLTISGTGAMPDYDDATYAPWYSLKDSITSVVIGSGIIRVGARSFPSYGLTDIQLPEGVLTVGDDAFVDYEGTELILPSTLQDAGSDAFAFANNIIDLYIPKAFLGDVASAFGSCGSLMEIGVDENNSVYAAIDGMVLSKDLSTLILAPCGRDVIEIPYGVTTIEHSALWASHAVEIVVPDTVNELYVAAFYTCESLASISLPEGITNIPVRCFGYDSSMETITLPSTLQSVGNAAFRDCSAVKTVTFRGTKAQWAAITWGTENEYVQNCVYGTK